MLFYRSLVRDITQSINEEVKLVPFHELFQRQATENNLFRLCLKLFRSRLNFAISKLYITDSRLIVFHGIAYNLDDAYRIGIVLHNRKLVFQLKLPILITQINITVLQNLKMKTDTFTQTR